MSSTPSPGTKIMCSTVKYFFFQFFLNEMLGYNNFLKKKEKQKRNLLFVLEKGFQWASRDIGWNRMEHIFRKIRFKLVALTMSMSHRTHSLVVICTGNRRAPFSRGQMIQRKSSGSPPDFLTCKHNGQNSKAEERSTAVNWFIQDRWMYLRKFKFLDSGEFAGLF